MNFRLDRGTNRYALDIQSIVRRQDVEPDPRR